MYYRNIFIGAGVTLKVTEGRAFQKPILKGTDVSNLNHIQGKKYLLKQNRMLAIEDVLHFFLSLSLSYTQAHKTHSPPLQTVLLLIVISLLFSALHKCRIQSVSSMEMLYYIMKLIMGNQFQNKIVCQMSTRTKL